MQQIEYDETRDMIREFSKAFGRPVNNVPTTPSVTDRLLLGNLLLEEVVEYICQGLGLTIYDTDTNEPLAIGKVSQLGLRHDEGYRYNPIEAADGLGDVNVIIHFNALWEGINLTAVTNEIHRSNMSKLDENGKPIINDVTPGYRSAATLSELRDSGWELDEDGYDPSRPTGKILKGPRYSPPNLLPILGIIPHEEEE